MSRPGRTSAWRRLHSRLLRTSALVPALAMMGGTSAFAQAVNLGRMNGNAIVPDGRTQTTLRGNGRTLNIRSSTYAGGNAYNSFDTFQEGAGNTVNLRARRGTKEIVNLVSGSAVDIEGTLNAYRGRKIGGNVVFADPYGFVVGPNGTINVGSLTVVTPSGATLDQMIDSKGHVNQALATQMIAGDVPLSQDGGVVIRGQISSKHFVRITAHDVEVAGSLGAARQAALHKAQFESTVNADRLVEGGSIVARHGSISIVAAGSETISGRLRASGGSAHGGSISLSAGQDVDIAATARLRAAALKTKRNAKTASSEAPSITVSAGEAATIAGTLTVHAATNGLAGTIGVVGSDIDISSTAAFTAGGSGTTSGGHISIKATDETTVVAGASFAANAIGTGDGGLVEISGNIDRVDPAIKVDLRSVSGKAGTLLFDPDQLIIGGTTQSPAPGDDATISTAGSLYTNGASVELDATSSITINGTIDTRAYAGDTTSGSQVAGLLSSSHVASTGNSGSITLNAPSITIASGGALYADVNNVGSTSYTGGAVTLTATTSSYLVIGFAKADSEILVNGTITGASITANATATAESVYALDANDNSPGAIASASALAIGLNLSPLNLSPGYVQSSGTAQVKIGGTASLTAINSGAVNLTAHTTDVSSDPALGISTSGTFLAGGVVVGETAANATVEIENGAHVTSGALTVVATNAATLAIKTTVISGTFGQQGAPVVFTVVYGATDVDANALIDSGAVINVSGASSTVNVLARNDNSFTAGATSYARNGGAAGTAIAISDFNSSAVAHIGTSLGTSSSKIGAVTVVAQDETAANQTSASTTVGQGTLADILSTLSTVGSIVGQGVQNQSFSAPDVGIVGTLFTATPFGKGLQTGGVSLPAVAGAVSLSFGTQTATASIAADVTTDANGNPTGRVAAAPTIYSASSVAVISDVTDAAFLNNAGSAVNSPTNGTTLNPTPSTALSAAVGYSDITHNSSAVIGPDVSITAADIGVQATTSIPSPIENVNWTDFYSSSPNSVVGSILANKLLATTATSSTSSSSGLSVAGALNFALFNVNTTAWVGDGASLTTTSASTGSATWSSPNLTALDTASGLSGYPNSTIQSTFTGDVSVTAKSLVETIDAAGNAGLFGGNISNGAGAVGATFGYIDDTTTTIAGIAQGASVSSDVVSGVGYGEVYVNALTVEHIVDVSPTNGAGQGLNVSGIVDVFNLNDTTLASISNTAHVQAKSVVINADDDLGVYAIAGDLSFSGSSGVGIAVAYTSLAGDTEAYVGDNSTLFSGSIGSVSLYVPGSPTYSGEIDTNTLDVAAKTSGNDVVAAIVGEVADGSAPSPPPVSASSTALAILGVAATKTVSSVSLTASGASAVADSALATKAYLDGATVHENGTVAGSYVKVDALNDMLTEVGSGGAAITSGSVTRQTSGALSGAISVEASSNQTLAYITQSTVTGMPSVDVQAATGGLTTVVGLGLSVNTSSNSSTSVSVAGSVSVIQVDDRVAAYIDSSNVTQGGNTGDAIVLADQATELGIGGGAFFLGGKSGIGLTLTYVNVIDPTSGLATDAHISNSTVTGFTDIDVVAQSPQIVYAGAATGGVTTSTALGGAFIFNYLDATTSATISNSGSSPLVVSASQNVNVIASANPSTVPMDTNATVQASDSGAASMKSEFAADPNDASSSDQADGALLGGNSAAIVAIAGNIEVGSGTNFGLSSVTNSIDEGHIAGIAGVTVTAPNAVTVAASDSTSIVALADGIAATSGNNAGEAAFVINTIAGGPSAYIGSSAVTAATTICGTNSNYVGAVTVAATNSSSITGIALSAALSNSASDGYAISDNDIETATTAAIVTATVTTTAGNGNLPNATGDIVVEGQSTGSIMAIAVGVAVSKNASVGGSVATNTEKGNVVTTVSGSTLYAANNAAVLASNSNAVNAIAGAAGIGLGVTGIGASVTIDQIGGTRSDHTAGGLTTAEISSSTVDAAATGLDTLQIVNGALVAGHTQTSVTPSSPSASVAPGALTTLGQDVYQDRGLVVVAGSSQTSIVSAVTLGISKVAAIAANSITTTMGGDTEATVTGSTLDSHLAAAAPILVAARSASYSNDLDLAVAAAASETGVLGGAATVVVNTMNRTTNAGLSGTSIGTSTEPAGAVTISANAWEATTGESIGVAGSVGTSFAGSSLVNLFGAQTNASLIGGTTYASSLSVKANTTDGYFGAVGAAAIGATTGVGASVIVAILNNQTSATVGDPADATATTLHLGGPLTVAATTTSDTQSYAVDAGIGSTGVAAMVTVNELTNATTAQVWDTTATIATTGTGDVNVTATESDAIDAVSGGIGGGSTGIGASINLVMLRSNDLATLRSDTITTPGAVNVGTTVTRDVDPVAVTAGIGAASGFAATVGVVLVGNAASSDEIGVLNQGGLLDSASSASTSATNLTAAAELAGTSCASGEDCLSASIANTSTNTITAASVNVSVTSKTDILNVVGSLGVGLNTGVGAAVGYTDLDQRIAATTFGGTIVTPSLTISASAGDDPSAEANGDGRAARTLAVAGAGGGYDGLGAAVAVSTANNTVTAQVGSTVNDGPSGTAGVTAASTTVLVAASDTSTALADAYGASVGLAAVGASVATATRSSTVTAEALGSAMIGAQTVTIQASESGATYSLGIGGAAGIVSGDGVDASATDSSNVEAKVDSGAMIAAIGTSTGGGLSVTASDSPDAKAFAFGVSVGAVAAGVSVSDAEAKAQVTAYVDGGADLAQTVGLTVSATSNASGTLATSFPSSTTVPGSTIEFTSGETTAAAWSIAGSGGLELAADATISTANSTTDVTAQTGNGLTLPSGAISVKATNTTNQFAQGDGVTLSEGYAVGAVVATAESSPTTIAEIGNSTLSTAMVVNTSNIVTTLGTQTVTINATGSDTNNATALAGAGGAVAGNGAAGTTVDDSTVTASIGDNSNISAEAISVAAKHTDIFSEMGDTLNASALGASAAYSSHTATSYVEANTGANVTLTASAAGQPLCSGNGCAAAISFAAENDFTDLSSGTQAAAGGGINGAGATSSISIDQSGGGASISIGAGDHFVSGTDASLAPGSIALIAQTNINVSDMDTLTTGGLLEGAGVNSTVEGVLNNTITIGAGASLATYGTLNLATFTMGSVSADSYVSTYGVASVGVADANIYLTENETINVVSGTSAIPTALAAFYNTYITAGEDLTHGEPGGNGISGSTSAEGYVRGVIAIPAANATTSITSNATVNLQPNTDVLAGENISIDAFHGAPTATADGTGHGFELGFIPVTDGNSSNPVTTTSNVTINGSVVAGVYATLSLTVNADGTVSEASGGAPVTYTYLSNPTESCAGGVTPTCLFTASEYSTLIGHTDLSSGNIPAIHFGALFASGGNVEIKADTLHGTGSVTAQGNPSITVTDAQPIALVFYGGALIPDIPAGVITYTGAANDAAAQTAGIHRTSTGSSTSGAITISLTNLSGGQGEGPPIIVDAPITNLGGSIVIKNSNGSLVYQTIYQYDSSGNVVVDSNNNPVAFSIGGSQANQLLVTVPFGALIVDAAGSPDGSYIVGSSPADEFSGQTIYPGGYTGTNANAAVEYVASSIFQNGLRTTDGLSANTGSPNEINAYLYGHGGNYTNESIQDVLVLYGTCGVGSAGAPCASSGFNVDSKIQPLYSNQTLYYSASSAQESTSGSATSKQIYGNLIEVNAATIDINGALYAGPATTYNVGISANMSSVLANLTYLHDNQYNNSPYFHSAAGIQALNSAYSVVEQYYGYSNQTLYKLYGINSIDITNLLAFGSTSATNVTATFNFATQQITLAPIEAHSIGASVTLNGAIISSNTLGNIHVNSGVGQVSVDNETGYGLVVQGINTGSVTNASAASTVTIHDTLRDTYSQQYIYNNNSYDTISYVYNPSVGVSVYLSNNGTSPFNSNGNLNAGVVLESPGTGASTATYSPVSGAAYEYVQEALLARTIYVSDNGSGSFSGSSDWYFLGNPNQPYYYVSPSSVSSLGSQTVAPQSAQSTVPVGQVIRESTSSPAFQETIYGNILRGGQSGCGHYYNCLYAYNNNDPAQGEYLEYYPDHAFIRITTVERADNPIAINFTGTLTSSTSITSNSAVTIAGDVKNPDGPTTINAGGSITQTAGSTISGISISLYSNGGIGTSSTPIVATVTNGLNSAPGSFLASTNNGSVYIQLNSGANGFGAYALGGDVVVNATGTLTASSNMQVVGNNVTLTSSQGSIGSTTAPLYALVEGGVLNASAYGDIGLIDNYGDLRIGQVASASGDIAIAVLNGSIYDARSQTTASSLSAAQVAAIATALHLTGTSDATAGSSAISSFQSLVNSELSSYATFIANGTIGTGSVTLDATTVSLYTTLANSSAIQAARATQSNTTYAPLTIAQIQSATNTLDTTNGVFTLNITSANRAGYQTQAAAALGITNPTSVSDAQIQAWANSQYQAYATTFSQAYGANWQTPVVPGATGSSSLLSLGTISNGVFTLNANGLAAYQSGAASVGITPNAAIYTTEATAALGSGATSAQITTYATNLYQAAVQTYANTLYAQTAVANAATVQTETNAALSGYKSISSLGTVSNGTFTLNANAISTYRVDAAQSLGITSGAAIYITEATTALGAGATSTQIAAYADNLYQTALAGVTNTQIQTYANSLYSGYATQLQTTYGATWQTLIAYNALTAIGTVSNGTFTLNAGSIATYQASAAQSLGISLASVTNAQVQTYANTLYSGYASQLQTAYGTNWQTSAPETANYASYSLDPNSALAATLTRSANWTTGQIVQAINLSALEPAVTTVGSSATPDIIGRNVTITTSAPGSSIGVYNPNGTVIAFSDVVNGTLSAANQAALAVATSPGSVTLIGTDASGHPLTNSSSLTAGSTITSIVVSETRPVFIEATGAVTIASQGSAYLQATGGSSINVNSVNAVGDVFLASPQSILTAVNASNIPLSSTQIQTMGDLFLAASGGSIGSATSPLTYSIGGSLVNGSAGVDSYLNVTGSNALIQRDSAGGTASITTAAGYSIFSSLSGVNVKASDIILVSGGVIGTSVTPFEIEGLVTSGGTVGTLSGSSAGLANIDAPNVAGALNSINVSQFTTQSGALTLAAGGLLNVTGQVMSGGSITIDAGSFAMTSAGLLDATGAVTIASFGDATIGNILTSYNPSSISPVVTITADGSILSATSIITPGVGVSIPVGATMLPDGTYFVGTPATLVATGANGTVSLTATDGIGLSTSPFVIAYASPMTATVTSANASIYIDATGHGLNATSLTAPGAIAIVAPSLTLGTVSGGPITLASTGNVTFSSLTAAAGDIDVTGASIDGTSTTVPAVKATNGAVSLTSTGADGALPSLDVTTVSATTTFGATAQGGGISLGSVTSGGLQTIGATGSIGFGTLVATTGDLGVTGLSISGTSVTAQGGAVTLASSGTSDTSINVATASAATTLGATASAGGITLGSATSAGTQTLTAAQDVTFTTLKTTGTGAIDVASTNGTVEGQVAGTSLIQSGSSVTVAGKVVALDTVTAATDATISAQTSLTGTQLTTTSGFASLTAGVSTDLSPAVPTLLSWATVDAGTTVMAQAYGGSIASLGSVTSGGLQTIGASGSIGFGTLVATTGDIGVTGLSISGTSVTAQGGAVTLASSGTSDTSISVATASAATTLGATASAGGITLGSATSAGTQTLAAARDVTFTTLKTTGTGAIDVTSTGGTVVGQVAGTSLIQSGSSVTVAGKVVALDTVTAATDATISAQTSLTGTQLTATSGFVSLTAGVSTDLSPTMPTLLSWATVDAGTTVSAQAYGGSIAALRTVTSGGLQTIGATGSIGFGTLVATTGDIGVTGLSISGTSVTAQGGAVTLASSGTSDTSISVATASAATTLGATASAGGISLGSATSAGTQTLTAAQDVTFTTLKTTGTGAIDVTSTGGTVEGQVAGTSLIQSGSSVTVAGKMVALDTVTAATDATISAQTSLTGTQLTTTSGFASLTAGVSTDLSPTMPTLLSWATVDAGTTVTAQAYGGSIASLGSVTSGGLQTIGATGSIGFGTLVATTGDIGVTGLSISGTSVTTQGGAVTLGSNGTSETSIDVATASAATTLGATASAGGISLGSATSVGTQTLTAAQDVTFTTLKTTGTGAIDVTSTGGTVEGQVAGMSLIQSGSSVTVAGKVVALNTVTAATNATISAQTSLTGTQLTATSGFASLTAGVSTDLSPAVPTLLTWATVDAGTTVTAQAYGGSIASLGTVTSGGLQTIGATGSIGFGTLTATTGDIGVTGLSISGTSVTAQGGAVTLASSGTSETSISVATASAATTLGATASAGGIALGSATSVGTQTLTAARDVTFTTLKTTGTGAIDVTSTGGTVDGQVAGTSLIQSGSSVTVAGKMVALDTVTAATNATISAQTSLTGTQLTATSGFASLTAGVSTDLSPAVPTLLSWATVDAGTTVTAQAYGGSIAALRTVTSGGLQTIGATGSIGFGTLVATTGDIGVTGLSISGTSVTAQGGAVTLASSGPSDTSISVATASAATTLGATASAGGITLGSATSAGTQTLTAARDVTFTTLKTTGTGAIDVASTNGTVEGQVAGTSLIQSGSSVTVAGKMVALDTVTAATNATISAQTSLTGTQLTTTSGFASLTAGVSTDLSPTMPTLLSWATVDAGTTVMAQAYGGSIASLGTVTSGGLQTIGATGSIGFGTLTATTGDIGVTGLSISGTSVTAQGGAVTLASSGPSDTSISVATASAATTLGATASAGGITLGSATSVGMQTLTAARDVTFTTLKTTGTGAIDVASTNGAITGLPLPTAGVITTPDSLDARGGFDLEATGTGGVVTATSLTAETGTGVVKATGAILLGSASTPAGTLDLTSTAGRVTLTSATSGGTQTIMGAAGVGYTALTTTAGDIDVISSAGSIVGSTVTAQGSATLSAYGDNTGTALVASIGSATLTSSHGRIGWETVTAATTFDTTASDGAVNFGTVTSGGTQQIKSYGNLVFTQLTTTGLSTDAGNVVLAAKPGAIKGGSISAHGAVNASGVGIVFDTIAAGGSLGLLSSADISGDALTSGGNIQIQSKGTTTLGGLTGGAVTLASPGTVVINDLTVATGANLAASDISIGILHQSPNVSGPLLLSITGYHGGIGQNAVLDIDAPNGVEITELREDPVTLTTNARNVVIDSAIVLGTMRLTTPDVNLWFDATTPQPSLGNSVQIYRPGGNFYLTLNDHVTDTNAYVVEYDSTSAIEQSVEGVIFYGPSFVRDFDRMDRVGDILPGYDPDGANELWSFPAEAFDRHLANLRDKKLKVNGNGPAVNLPPLLDTQDSFHALFTRASR